MLSIICNVNFCQDIFTHQVKSIIQEPTTTIFGVMSHSYFSFFSYDILIRIPKLYFLKQVFFNKVLTAATRW